VVTQIETLRRTLVAHQTEEVRLRESSLRLQGQLGSVQNELAHASQRGAVLADDLFQARQDIAALRAEIGGLNEHVSELRRQLEQSQIDVLMLQVRLADVEPSSGVVFVMLVSDWQKQQTQMHDELRAARSDAAALRSDRDTMQTELQLAIEVCPCWT
jgi:chromosome segregation ATPase